MFSSWATEYYPGLPVPVNIAAPVPTRPTVLMMHTRRTRNQQPSTTHQRSPPSHPIQQPSTTFIRPQPSTSYVRPQPKTRYPGEQPTSDPRHQPSNSRQQPSANRAPRRASCRSTRSTRSTQSSTYVTVPPPVTFPPPSPVGPVVPYYRAAKPWHRQKWQEKPDTPLHRHINSVLVQKLMEHVGRKPDDETTELWTATSVCKWWVCEHCLEIPLQPVTTTCGHTVCRPCAQQIGVCKCGTDLPIPLVANCLITKLVGALTPQDEEQRRRIGYCNLEELEAQRRLTATAQAHEPRATTSTGLAEGAGRSQFSNYVNSDASSSTTSENESQHSTPPSNGAQSQYPASNDFSPSNLPMAVPATWPISFIMDTRNRPISSPSRSSPFETARDMVASGSDEEAVPLLKELITSGSERQLASFASEILIVVIKKRRRSTMVRNLRGIILGRDARNLCLHGELECVLCTQLLRQPVTTPCGHSYCRACLERCIDYTTACPLCSAKLSDFNVDAVYNNAFLARLIQIADVPQEPDPDPESDDRLPIFVCTVAYPMVPCPLFVFEPRYRLMIRRCLRSGSRRFGIVAPCNSNGYVDYGTMLEVRDSIRLSDGRHIISTIGVSRFRILERGVRDGYDVARVEQLQDTTIRRLSDRFGRLRYNLNLRHKAEAWLRSMGPQARAEVETTFGAMPPLDRSIWTPDGPAWLWWVLALLPLDNNLKVMILSNPDVNKRMAVVERTLEIMRLFSDPTTNNCGPVTRAQTHRETPPSQVCSLLL